MGIWYELKRQKGISFYDDSDKCTVAKYEPKPRGTIEVTNSSNDKYGRLNVGPGHGEVSKFSPGEISVSFGYDFSAGKFQVVDTDYTSYSVVYSCQ